MKPRRTSSRHSKIKGINACAVSCGGVLYDAYGDHPSRVWRRLGLPCWLPELPCWRQVMLPYSAHLRMCSLPTRAPHFAVCCFPYPFCFYFPPTLFLFSCLKCLETKSRLDPIHVRLENTATGGRKTTCVNMDRVQFAPDAQGTKNGDGLS